MTVEVQIDHYLSALPVRLVADRWNQGNRMNVKLISPSPTGARSQTGQIASPSRRDRSKSPRTLCGQLSPSGAQSS